MVLLVEGADLPHRFHLHQERAGLEEWLGRYFGFPVYLRHDTNTGFPDDPYWKGPTVVGGQTLNEVASWFPGLTVDDVRWRFRANLEIGNAAPFWEVPTVRRHAGPRAGRTDGAGRGRRQDSGIGRRRARYLINSPAPAPPAATGSGARRLLR